MEKDSARQGTRGGSVGQNPLRGGFLPAGFGSGNPLGTSALSTAFGCVKASVRETALRPVIVKQFALLSPHRTIPVEGTNGAMYAEVQEPACSWIT